MLEFCNAVNQDATGKYLDAIKIYESVIEGENPPIDAFINLSFLYWLCASDFAFRDAYDIPYIWSSIGDERYSYILDLGLLHYPHDAELHFWSKYYPHRYFFDNFSQEECLQIINSYTERKSLVPYFFLYLFDKNKYKTQREMLLIECIAQPTAKNTYIKSIIE